MKIAVAQKQQGGRLESVAIEQLVERRELLETYQNRARFAFADSYDRAAKAQAQSQVQSQVQSQSQVPNQNQPPAQVQ